MKTLEKLSQLAGNLFSIGILVVAVLAFLAPGGFIWIAPHISTLLGIVMFGMGLTLTAEDFKTVLKQPKLVLIGVILQFTIMPLIAYGLAVGLQLSPELAAGVILVGCCPGGTSSNVITLLARGNVALSVAMTSVSTLLAPVMTPALTLLLASKWLPVSAASMLVSVVKMVLLPIALGFVVKMLFPKQVTAGVKALPLVSIVAIVAIVAAVVSANQGTLAETGPILILVVVLHNVLGYALSYGAARVLRLGHAEVKTMAIEVGMQNSGLGAALATAHFSPLAAVPSAIFSVWHNISGSLLASWWGKDRQAAESPVGTAPPIK